jgi:catechol 2,3-dioxygenase-like lactoylglutathione lyase family enzyme
MDTKFRLELVQVPVTDVDRARAFYAGQLGFDVDHDTRVGDDFRVVQLTPPGSACSIAVGKGMVKMPPGSQQGLQLVVSDIRAARARLAGRGVEISEVRVYDSGSFRPARERDALDNVGFAFFADPDGNGWVVQQISARGEAGPER